jgi:Arc/MetJ-type ribon-helix-helix transcriptional regulator
MESFIQQEVASGAFRSREEAIEAGVTMLRNRRDLMNRLAESRRQVDEGEYLEYDDESLRQLFEQLIARAFFTRRSLPSDQPHPTQIGFA